MHFAFDSMTVSALTVCMQDDVMMPQVTVGEVLRFYAAVVLPPRMPRADRAARIESALAVMGLKQAQNTLVREAPGSV